MNYPMPSIDIAGIMPEIILTVAASVVLLAEVYIKDDKKENLFLISLVGVLCSLFVNIGQFNSGRTIFDGMYIVDNYSVFFKTTFLIVSALVLLISPTFGKGKRLGGEYYSLILFATTGMMIMASGGDLLTVYVGLELMALSSYCLVGIIKGSQRTLEASLKYFLTGAFTSGIMLYGIALLYGVTGTTGLEGIQSYFVKNSGEPSMMLIAAVIMLIAGFSFKIAAVPFHVWAPDIYDGAPTTVTAFITVGSKFAGFAALIRLLSFSLLSVKPYWSVIFSILAVLTMSLGNIMAIYQSSLKRLLAYSSIAHAGYILIGLIASNKTGVASVLFYSIAYAFMNIGAFSVLMIMNKEGGDNFDIDGLKGMSRTNPVLSFVILIFFLSLAGIPPTVGFVGKFYIFSSAVEANLIWLAIAGALNSFISIYYYLRVVMVMYMDNPEGEERIEFPQSLCVAVSIMAIAVIVLGLFPNLLFEASKLSAFV